MKFPDIREDSEAQRMFRKESLITLGTDMEVSLHKKHSPFEAVNGLKYWTGVKDGQIGTDGRTKFFKYLIELRPSPGYSGRDVCNNMVDIVADAIKIRPELTSYRWKAGTCDYTFINDNEEGGNVAYCLPKGGHIHFGNCECHPNLIYCFDMLLAPIILVLEDPIRAIIRRTRMHSFGGGTLYGQLGGMRKSAKYPTWEYRTLPNFCKSPELTIAMFDCAKAIAHEFFTNPKFIEAMKSKFHYLYPDVFSFNLCIKQEFKKHINLIFKLLRNLKLLKSDYGQHMLAWLQKYVTETPQWEIQSDMLTDFNIVPKEVAKTKTKEVKRRFNPKYELILNHLNALIGPPLEDQTILADDEDTGAIYQFTTDLLDNANMIMNTDGTVLEKVVSIMETPREIRNLISTHLGSGIKNFYTNYLSKVKEPKFHHSAERAFRVVSNMNVDLCSSAILI